MRTEVLPTINRDMPPLQLSSNERYELIAQAAQNISDIDESTFSREDELKHIWNTNDIEINIGCIFVLYE